MLNFLKKIDHLVLATVLPIMIFGLFTMSSLKGVNGSFFDPFFIKQSVFIMLSIITIISLSFLDFRFLRDSYVVSTLYFISLSLLVLVLLIGSTINGAKAWFNLGIVSFEPSDLMKLSIIILFAKYFSKRHVEIANLKHILISGFYMAIPFLLIMKQPDLGSGLVIFSIWFGMIFISGLSRKHLIVLIGLGIISFVILWNFYFKEYQKLRIITFINPTYDLRGSGYNVYQATIAVGSGGFFGKGLGYGTQGRLNFLPEHETDFIFASFLEEWGMLGGIIVFSLISILIYHLTRLSLRAETNFEALFILGVCIYLLAHFIINMGMNIGLLPVTGIPLPFMSYGGSHLLIESICLGICIGMSRYSRASHPSKMKNEFLGFE